VGAGKIELCRWRARSCEQLDVAVVVADVALEDVRAGPHDALEARAVQLDALERRARHHRRRARPVQQKRYLA